MLFAASLIYAMLFPLLAIFFPVAAKVVPFLPNIVAVGLLHAGFYLLLVMALRLSHCVWEDALGNQSNARQLRAWLDVRGCQWLNLASLLILGTITGLLAVSGLLPYQNWFLCGAGLLGMHDLYRGNPLLRFRNELPAPRFNLEAVTPLADASGRTVAFGWNLWEASTPGTGSLNAAFTIGETDYSVAKSLSRYPVVPVENYIRYPREQFNASVQQVAAFFRKHSETHGFSPLMEMANIVCFVRSIRYAPDEETRNQPEWANFAVETLYDAAGDCEDHAILAAALLHYLGHSVALFYLDLEDCGHIAIGFECPDGGGIFFATGADGRTYYYVETVPTSSAERVGDLSAEFLAHLKEWKVLPVASGLSVHS
jgi:hypothetical protein